MSELTVLFVLFFYNGLFVASLLSYSAAVPAGSLALYLLNRADAKDPPLAAFLVIILGIVFGFFLSLSFLFVGVGALVCVNSSNIDGSDMPL
jgi:hypothetical protein